MKKRFFSAQIAKKLGSVGKLPRWLKEYPESQNDQLKMIRETLGMTQDQLAKRAGFSLRHLQSFESGKIVPAFDALEKIAAALNAELKVFLIPKKGLTEFLDEKADQKARQLVGFDQASSSLEVQTPSEEMRKERIRSMKKEILEKRRSSLWD
jgi:transcriptional regulator with XRE-family HTH domain